MQKKLLSHFMKIFYSNAGYCYSKHIAIRDSRYPPQKSSFLLCEAIDAVTITQQNILFVVVVVVQCRNYIKPSNQTHSKHFFVREYTQYSQSLNCNGMEKSLLLSFSYSIIFRWPLCASFALAFHPLSFFLFSTYFSLPLFLSLTFFLQSPPSFLAIQQKYGSLLALG